MPGRFKPPSVGPRPHNAQEIMNAVYEKARTKGYSKTRSAKIGWGAVHRAGYHPGKLLDPEPYKEYVCDTCGQRRMSERTSKGHCRMFGHKVKPYDPMARQIRQSGRTLLGSGVGAARTARGIGRRVSGLRSLRSRIPRIRPPTAQAPTTPRTRSRPLGTRRPDPRLYADPARLPEPDDYAGYDNLNLVRLVPSAEKKGHVPVKRLMEGQIVLPPHQWENIAKEVEDWPDVQFSDEDKDGVPDRIIRRGHKNYQTNLFIDKA